MSSKRSQFRPVLEGLEDRTVPYALSGSSWANLSVTYSFMPDGTTMSGGTSALFATLNAVASTAVWQAEIDRAMQTWAAASGLTITRVSDDGSPQGIAGSAQGDSRFGDIRIGAYPMDALGYTWYPSSSTRGGDIELTTSHTFQIGSVYDLYSVVLHEAGHAVGLAHSDVSGAVMQVAAYSIFAGLHADDIAGIQVLYGPDGGTPPPSLTPDRFEVNNTMGTAKHFGTVASINQTTLTVHTSSDLDFYSFAPKWTATYNVSINFSNAQGNLDLIVYNASGAVVGSSATAGDTELVRLSLTKGKKYYVKVVGAAGAQNTYSFTVAKYTAGGALSLPGDVVEGAGWLRRKHARRLRH